MPNMPALALIERALIGGMAEEGSTTELLAYRDDILAAVRQLEESLDCKVICTYISINKQVATRQCACP